MFEVKFHLLLFLTGTLMNGATSMTHTLRDFKTSSTQVQNFPEFVVVGMVNGLQIYYYDSNTRRAVPKQDWMNRVTEDDPNFWERNTEIGFIDYVYSNYNLEILKKRLNLTDGLHVHQVMSGCEWDDETNEIRGFYTYAFDGEDFISLDWDTQTWIAAKPQAVTTKLRWEQDGLAAQIKYEVIHKCVVNLKKFVKLGENVLLRKELPLVSLLQKSSSSPVTCHATGFYPEEAMLFWTKDGDELYEDVKYWEVLPNHDGTFQKSADLDLSSVPVEDRGRYNCVFQLSGVPDDLITKLDRRLIFPREEPNTVIPIIILTGMSILGLAVCVGAGAFGFMLSRRSLYDNVRQRSE